MDCRGGVPLVAELLSPAEVGIGGEEGAEEEAVGEAEVVDGELEEVEEGLGELEVVVPLAEFVEAEVAGEVVEGEEVEVDLVDEVLVVEGAPEHTAFLVTGDKSEKLKEKIKNAKKK